MTRRQSLDAAPVALGGFRIKYLVFSLIALMTLYVLYHNERFLIDPAAPVWEHYKDLGWWLLIHGVAGACALLLAPMQFSDRLRTRFRKLHRVAGRVYVGSVFVLGPFGAYVQYLDESIGATRSFTVLTVIEAAMLALTTGLGLYFAARRNISQHRQWMTRSYAIALVFIEARVILGVTGWNEPFDWAITETVVWVCMVFSVLIGDIANQLYDWPRPARGPSTENIAVSVARS
jgi:uncharacterized membrane protein